MAHMTFADKFDSLSLGNGSSGTWQPSYSWSPNGYTNQTLGSWEVNPNYGPTSAPDADTYSVNNGVLKMAVIPRPSDVSASAVGYKPFLSGLLQTQHSFSQLYGYFAINAKMPSTPGLHPAFWLLPEDGSRPPELDTVEMIGSDPTTLVMTDWSGSSSNPVPHQQWVTIPNSSQAFHTYGVDWEPNTITWYFDGNPVAQQPTPSDMHVPMYMLMEIEAGVQGGWGGAPAPNAHGAMRVNWVRAYSSFPGQSGGGSSGVISPGSGSFTDEAGNIYSIDASGQADENGKPIPGGSDTAAMELYNGLVYGQDASTHLWYTWNQSTWTPASPPLGVAASPDLSSSSNSLGSSQPTMTISTDIRPDVTVDGTQVQNQTVDGAQIQTTAPGTAKIALGSTSDSLQFIGMTSVTVTAGSAASSVTADSGNNTFIAGAAPLNVTGGSGANAYILHAGDATLSINDFSPAKGDTLTIDQSLRGSLSETQGASGGLVLSFGSSSGHIVLPNASSVPASAVHFA